jgi:hypothetical protein
MAKPNPITNPSSKAVRAGGAMLDAELITAIIDEASSIACLISAARLAGLSNDRLTMMDALGVAEDRAEGFLKDLKLAVSNALFDLAASNGRHGSRVQ